MAKSSPLKFISENIIDAPVINYHNQVYEFESNLEDLSGNSDEIKYGILELLNIQGKLVKNL